MPDSPRDSTIVPGDEGRRPAVKRALIVDDQGDVRRLLRLTLAPLAWEVHEADNGGDAIRLARSLRPDVVLLDVMLPGGVDGLEVCRSIKADPANAGTFVIMLSARGQHWDIEAGMRERADRYIIKPFSPLELLEIVQGIGTRAPPP